MKRNYIIGLFGLSAAALLGCPVFSGGGNTGPCDSYGCFCSTSYDCADGLYCLDNYCGAPGFDGGGFVDGGFPEGGGGACEGGCAPDEVCAVVDGGAVCVPAPDGGSPGDATTDAPAFTGCTSDATCADAGVGYICLDGACVAPANQCTDSTQCPDSEQCVDGACVPGCTSAAPTCPDGYSCNTSTGVCTGNPTPCGAAPGAMACKGDTTCVDEHCVPKCGSGDAACGPDLVCVDNGCIPDQKPNFVCDKSGQTPGTQDVCKSGSICLHHNCYIACGGEVDAGGYCSTATGTKYPICKGVADGTGTFSVCASSTNLGSECDPTSTPPKTCTTSGQVCIDGYCE